MLLPVSVKKKRMESITATILYLSDDLAKMQEFAKFCKLLNDISVAVGRDDTFVRSYIDQIYPYV